MTRSVFGNNSISLRRRALSGSLWLSSQWLLNKAAAAASTLVIAHFLSPDDFGLAATAFAFATLVYFMPLTAMGDVLVAYPGRIELLAPTAVRLSWVISGVGSCLMLSSIPLALQLYRQYPVAWLGWLLVALAIRPVLEGLCVVPLSNLRQSFRFRSIALIDGILQLAATLLSAVLAAAGARSVSLVLPQILNQAGRAIGYSRSGRVKRTWRVHRTIACLLMRGYVQSSTAQYLHGLILQVGAIIVGYGAGAFQAGLFGFSMMLVVQINTMIATRLGEVMQPILGALQRDRLRQVRAFLRSQQLLGSICVPLALLQCVLAEPLFGLLFDEKWRPAIPVFQILALRELFAFAAGPSRSCLKAQGRFGVLLIYQAIQIVVTLPFYWFGAWQGGAIGVAVVSAVTWSVTTPFVTWMCTRIGSRGEFRSVVWLFARPLLVTLPVFVVGYAIVDFLNGWETIGDLLAVVVLGPVLMVLAFLAVRLVDSEFRSLLDGVLDSGRHRVVQWIRGFGRTHS